MTMGGWTQLQQAAGYAKVTGATGSSTPGTGNQNRDGLVSATARTGAGIYTVTLKDGGIDARECQAAVRLTAAGTAGPEAKVDQASDTVFNVTTFNAAGAAADLDFEFVLWKLAQVHA